MAAVSEAEMNNLNENEANSTDVDSYRTLVQTYLSLHLYQAALFWADKVVALTNGNPRDVYWLAQCMYQQKQYHRAAHLLRIRNLDKMYILCNNLTARCLLEAGEYSEALKIINSMDSDVMTHHMSTTPFIPSLENGMFDETPVHQVKSSAFLLKGRILEAMDNRGLAADCYRMALQNDVHCFEAFECLIQHNMLQAAEEEDLLASLPIETQCSTREAEILKLLYRGKLKKYHTPTEYLRTSELNETASGSSLLSTSDEVYLHRLQDSLDMIVSKAEQMYYNCDYLQCISLTEKILKQDPYHSDCLPVHISCLVELKQSNKLFSLAHKLVDLYPNLALSWFAVGCYYYIIGKSDFARRYLAKATTLDKLFGPAWLAYGHSFAVENEHDQAMAAYFKASQLMKGCHLPFMYIGLECGLTNNIRLAEKFFRQANKIAPDDPFVLHEMGVIAFQNAEYALAELHFKEALKILKNHKGALVPERWAPLHNNLGHALRKQRKFKQALEHHHEALVLMPQSPSTYSAIAFVHALANELEEAVDWFHKALGLRRDDTFSSTMLVYVIENLATEQAPYLDAPSYIPNFERKTLLTSAEAVVNSLPSEVIKEEPEAELISIQELSDTNESNNDSMSMSLEMDTSGKD